MSTGLSLITYAQQAGPNINVLPIVLPTDPNDPSSVLDAALLGDLFLNRQVEPAIAVSTRNPAHILSFFNDYRAVNIPDPGIGDEHPGTVTLAWRYVQKFFARLVGRPEPPKAKPELKLPALAAAAEAWVGGSRSYDGGQTWSGMFLPGAPFDTSDAANASPVRGLSAATDPVLAAGPCGKFYLGFLAFDRGGASKMAVATYQDLNNEQGGDTIVYQGTKVLESANNANWGYFLDKPAIGVDVARGNPADPCAHNVYVTYTTFNGLTKDGKAQTKITLARSTNSGQTYSVGKLNQPFQQGQGTAIAIDPRDGTPTTTGGGTLYIAFRHFNAPDTIVIQKSTNFGQTFNGQPVDLLASSTPSSLQKYDQPTIATLDTADPPTDLMFRSLAFPTIAVTGNGTVMVAWTERVGIDSSNAQTFRKPLATGSPRIVLMRSTNGGSTWTDVNGVANSRLAIDVGRRDEGPLTPPAGLGFLPQPRDSGPQIQPFLSFGAGKLMILYYESRGFMTRAPDAEMILPADLTPSRNFATGIDRLFDARAALLNTSTGAAVGSAQVSRYTLKTFADLSNGETLDDVLAVNSPCSPDDGDGLVPCERRVDRANKPTARSGTSPSKGDYVGLTPAVTMVPRANGTGWRWAINADDVPARAFHGIFSDNRNLVSASQPANLPEWQRYQYYVPPFTPGCSNAGSRNSDVFVSRIDGDVVLTAPTTYTQLQNIQRTFPLVVSSSAGVNRYFRLSFVSGGNIASFRQESNLDQEDILVYPFSSGTRVVYIGDCSTGNCIAPGSPQAVTVRVQQIDGPGGNIVANGASGTVTLNGDSSNPLVINDGISNTELHNPDIGAPDIGAPDIGAPDIGAPDIGAPDIGAPDIGAPDIGASAPAEYVSVQDTTWTLTNIGNTSSAYTANIHIDHPELYTQDYAFQLIIHKSGGFGALTDCAAANHTQSRIISIIANPDIGAPDIGAPDIGAPDIGAPDIGAATFAMAPSESLTSSAVSGFAARQQTGGGNMNPSAPSTNDGTLKAPKAPETIQVTLRAYQRTQNPSVIFDPTLSLPAIAIKQQSKNNNNGVLQPLGVIAQGADLVVASGAPSLTPSTVQAGSALTIGAWTLQNVGNIAAAPPTVAQGGDGLINSSVYLSSNATFGGDDVLLGSAGITGPLAAGATQTFPAFPVTIPAGTTPGTYYLFIVADDGSQSVTGEVNELNENNNVSPAASFTVTVPNVAPVAGNQSVTTNEDTAKPITLTATDANNDAVTFSFTQPAHGSVTGSGANVTYTPSADYNGSDSFTFKANDGSLDSNVATVSITINPVNDAPVASSQAVSTTEDTAVGIALGATDIDSATLTYSRSNPSHGTLSGTGASLTYTPAANYNGPDSFTFTANDGSLNSNVATVSINVTPVNDAPIANSQSVSTNEDTPLPITLGGSDVDSTFTLSLVAGPSHGILSGTPPSLTYTPAANYNGADSFTFKANDGSLDSNVATVSITVIPVNDAPVANAQSKNVTENTATQIALTASDVDSGTLTYSLVTQPAHGSLSGTAPNVTYTPQVNYVGPDSFTFRANDGSLNSNTATVSITVVQGIDQYGFNGLLGSYAPPPKSGNLGSSQPVVWQYTLGGVVVNTSTEMPKVTFTKMNATNSTCTSPAGDMTPVPNSTYFENSDTPGNSSFQYNANTNTWQFNWQTGPPVSAGCWSIRVILPRTGQVNGPFPLKLGK